jgi:acyl-coenzyme A synthetase/AMP-(fatty) acid ligase
MVSCIGTRLLPSTIDDIAASDPHRIWVSIPNDGSDVSKGFKDITYQQFSNAINHAAAWLDSNLGHSATDTFEVVAYQGPNDHRLPALAVAAAKVGKQVRWSIAAWEKRLTSLQLLIPFSLAPAPVKQHLVDAAKCKYYVHPEGAQEQVCNLLDARTHIRAIVMPSLGDWFTDTAASYYPFSKSWDEANNDPWLIFHTSGSTGKWKLKVL